MPSRIVEQLRKGELISEDEVHELCFLARDILLDEGNVQKVSAPVTVRRERDVRTDDIYLDPPCVDMWRHSRTVL